MKSEIVLNYVNHMKKFLHMERKAEINLMIDEIKELSANQRQEKGRTLLNLKGKYEGREIGGFSLIKYGSKNEIKTNISVGDVVLISKKDPLQNGIEGTVIEKGNKYITISFSNNLPEWLLENVRIDLYVNDVTFKRMAEALDKFIEFDSVVKKVLFKSNNCDEIIEDIMIEKFEDEKLNDYQKDAVRKAVNTEGVYIIHGPPGTGKTRTLTEIIVQFSKQNKKILVTADSNVAADNILENLSMYNFLNVVRLGHPARVNKKILDNTIYKKVENLKIFGQIEALREEIDYLINERKSYKKPSPAYRRGLSFNEIKKYSKKSSKKRGLDSKIIKSMANWLDLTETIKIYYTELRHLEEFAFKTVVENSDVIVTTNSTSGSEILEDYFYDVCVIDESSQALEAASLIPAVRAKKLILAGDNKQLPPTILCKEAENELSVTLFDKLIEKFPNKTSLLRYQYRMNDKIMNFSNRYFYNDKLISDETVKNEKINISDETYDFLNGENIISFIDTSKSLDNYEIIKEGSKSKLNIFEAEIIIKIIEKLKNYVSLENIGIITPYLDQVKYLREKNSYEDLEINTVDGFQGREKEIIIISFVRSNEEKEIGFLKDERRLNVSLTRAKKKLIIIGNSSTLISGLMYKNLYNYIKENGKIYSMEGKNENFEISFF